MRSITEFNEAFEKLHQELSAMSGKEFFAMFDLNLNDLPPEPQCNINISIAFILKTTQGLSPAYSSIDLQCA